MSVRLVGCLVLLFLCGCGPSDSEILAAFKSHAPGWGIRYDTNGNLNAVKLNKVRVDGRSRDDVWRINYDVPVAGGNKVWYTAHVAYKNGRIDLIRTDREGVVDAKGEIQSLSIDPLKYNRR